MLTKLEIENFKSIHKESIDLGRVNVFIGTNGCGKTNILEALGMASAAKSDKLKNDELAFKGIRVAKPIITINSFLNQRKKKSIKIRLEFNIENKKIELSTKLYSEKVNEINSNWIYKQDITYERKTYLTNILKNSFDNQITDLKELFKSVESYENLLEDFQNKEKSNSSQLDNKFAQIKKEYSLLKKELEEKISKNTEYQIAIDEVENINGKIKLEEFTIYNLSTRILRGIGGTSLEIPGIHGENLDYLIKSFSKEEMEELEHHASMISWLDEIIIDKEDALKLQGHKLNLSSSKLYFRDKFMQKKNNVFSAENANEGILHILFYIALFISKKTPKLFAIDNIETALNPGLCRNLIEILVKLAKKHDKQVLITTHNPAILDGINLHDEEQRIFTVARNFKGHTKVKRLQIKPDKEVGGHKLKLSELWMRNYLGAIPQHI